MTTSRWEAIDPSAEAGTDLKYVYTLIHSFLKERSHTKAASALKKAVTGIITIDDSAEYEGPTLQKILKEWRELKAAADATDTSTSDSSSDSSDDVSQVEDNLAVKKSSKSKPSDSSEDSSSDTPQRVVPQVVKLRESQRDSSKTLSSADDVESDEESADETGSDSSDESDVDKDSGSVPTFKEVRGKREIIATSSSDDTSSSDSDSSTDEEDELPSVPKHKARSTSSSDSSPSSDSDSDEDSKPLTTNKLKRKVASSSDSSSEPASSSSDSSSENVDPLKIQLTIKAIARSSASSTSSSSSRPEDELEETPAMSVAPDPEARAMKKRRANEEGTAVIAATTAKTVGDARGGKASRKPNTPFQRVNAHAVKYYDEKLKDNSFESRGAHADDYGARANRDLMVTRGSGFRKEKNKKKRGSYRGGDITFHSHSFKFED